jgi:alkylhydroperoxidase/carboxymuconolactone decarboxylase family protein YurZ
MPPTPEDLTKILSTSDLKAIKSKYDPIAMGNVLSFTLTHQYQAITPYMTAMGGALYPEMQTGATPSPLPAENRERCLVALLAGRSRRLQLAVHIYLALANGVEPPELVHILLATGVYTGFDTVPSSFEVMQTTLDALKDVVAKKTPDPATVLGALAGALPD